MVIMMAQISNDDDDDDDDDENDDECDSSTSSLLELYYDIRDITTQKDLNRHLDVSLFLRT